jgi:hypothetical protein
MQRSEAMRSIVIPLIRTLNSGFRTRAVLLAEIPAPRHRYERPTA